MRELPQANNDLERLHSWKHTTVVSSAGTEGDINLEWGENFDAVWTNFAKLSHTFKAEDPSAKYRATLAKLPRPQTKPKLLYLDRSGATAGQSTFVDAVFRQAGAENVIKSSGWLTLDTEVLLTLAPDAIVTSFMGSDYVGVNDRSVRHSALAQKIKNLPQIDIHGGLWPCAGPGLVDATVQISDAIRML